MWRSKPERADLSETPAFLLQLLDDTRAWRQRLVEELTFASATHVRRTASYQVDFPPELLAAFELESTHRANLLLPLTTRSKEPLFNLDLIGPDGSSASLLPRRSIAGLERRYLRSLVRSSPVADRLRGRIRNRTLEAICLCSPLFFRETFLTAAKGDHPTALHRYLQDGLGFDIRLDDVERWRERTQPAGRALAGVLGDQPDPLSSSEEVLLAIPHLVPQPPNVPQIDRIVYGYCDAVEAARAANDTDFLIALAEYGRRYEIILELEVPLLEPSTIKLREDLPLEHSNGWVEHRFSLGDARSAHLEARVSDVHVEIEIGDQYRAACLDGSDAAGYLEAVRLSRESLSIYSSVDNRPYYIDVALKIQPARHLAITAAGLILASLLAMVATLAIPEDAAFVERIAVLAVPTTVAAAFVLTRDQSPLATRLLMRWRAALALTTLALWVVVLISLVSFDQPATTKPIESSPSVDGESNSVGDSRSRMQEEELRDGDERSTR